MLTLQDINLAGKKVLIREDLNVPYKKGIILNDARIKAALPTLEAALKAQARVLVVSHLGRPKPGVDNTEFSLKKVADRLAELLPYPVKFVENWLDHFDGKPGELTVAENVRFFPGEEKNDLNLAKQMAALCEVFVMDAFACAHRAHASTAGIAKFVPCTVAGPLMLKELQALSKILHGGHKPVVALIGGSKISTKLQVLRELMSKVNVLLLGGGLANTFLAAQGHKIGGSLYEADMLDLAKELLVSAKQQKCQLILPIDVVIASDSDAKNIKTIDIDNIISEQEKIFDLGPKTIENYTRHLQQAKTILWNGPVGLFETQDFAKGSQQLALAISANTAAFSVAGGGETLAVIEQLGIQDKLSFVSTAGGAFLEYIEGKTLPGVAALG